MSASFINTVIAPATPKSSVVMGFFLLSVPMTMRPMRARISARLVESARIAIISLATLISNPDWRIGPSSRSPSPLMIWRSARSFISTTRFQVMLYGSMLSLRSPIFSKYASLQRLS